MKDTLTKQEAMDLCNNKIQDLNAKAEALKVKADALVLESKVWEKTRDELVKLFA